MRYVQLGRTDLQVSTVCLGCMGFGDANTGQHCWTIDEAQTRTILKAAFEGGINFLDTAIAYQNGTSEQYVGRAVKDFISRDQVIIADKFLPRSDADIAAGVSGRDHVVRMCEQSLRHLGTDYIDLYIYHMWDWRTPLLEILTGLHDLVTAGKVRYLGISNCFAYQLAKANALAHEHGLTPFVCMQGHYNLIFREEEREMLPLCREDGIAYTPYSPLAAGRLSRPHTEHTKRFDLDSYAHFKYDQTADADQLIIDRVSEIAQKRSVSMTAVALSWLNSKGAIPIAGVTKLEQVDALIAGSDLQLTADECAYLEAPYVPHPLAGVMAQNRPDAANAPKVWHQANACLK